MQNQSWQSRTERRKKKTRQRVLWFAGLLLMTGMAVVGLVNLIRYGSDYISSRRNSAELQELYREAGDETQAPEQRAEALETEPPEGLESPEVEMAAQAIPEAAALGEGNTASAPEATLEPPEATETPAPTSTPLARLQALIYPENAKLTVDSRFQPLRKENADIIGWLHADTLLDEAVVQRNNVYYLNHDAKRQENVNGALFLDAAVSLKTRPYALVIYGHNMKSGAMFGCLRNYENLTFYRKSPFLTFDTIYEQGKYVIFAAGSVRVTEGSVRSVDLYSLMSDRVEARRQAISTLRICSAFTCGIEVEPEDQLLLLVTCVDNEDDRRVVAARRVRDGESETELLRQVAGARAQ